MPWWSNSGRSWWNGVFVYYIRNDFPIRTSCVIVWLANGWLLVVVLKLKYTN